MQAVVNKPRSTPRRSPYGPSAPRTDRASSSPLHAFGSRGANRIGQGAARALTPHRGPEVRLAQLQSRVDQGSRSRRMERLAETIDDGPTVVAQRQRALDLHQGPIPAGSPVQRMRIFEPDAEELEAIVEKMRTRAEGATSAMLYDFAEFHGTYRYRVATNEAEGAAERFAIMSLKAPPTIQAGEPPGLNPNVDDSLWVEGVVADAGSRLGGVLLTRAEDMAVAEGKSAVALAAYEAADDGVYSVAGYYQDRRGYRYSGEGYEEVDSEGGEPHFYPIYYKTTAAIREAREAQEHD